jgi:hypothetical protein
MEMESSASTRPWFLLGESHAWQDTKAGGNDSSQGITSPSYDFKYERGVTARKVQGLPSGSTQLLLGPERPTHCLKGGKWVIIMLLSRLF